MVFYYKIYSSASDVIQYILYVDKTVKTPFNVWYSTGIELLGRFAANKGLLWTEPYAFLNYIYFLPVLGEKGVVNHIEFGCIQW